MTKQHAWPAGQSEMANRIRHHDWGSTPLGPTEQWTASLRTAVDMMLASPGPVSILWGREYVQLYNDAYVLIAAERHPAALGKTVAENWSEAYSSFLGPVLDRAFSGETVTVEEHAVSLERADGSAEERFFTGSFLPVRGATGDVEGIFHSLVEVTEQIRTAAELRQREDRLHRVLDGMGEGFGLLAPDFTILEHNREALRLDGRPREEIVGRSHWEAFPGSEHSELGRALRQAMANRQPVALEHCYAWENDRALWLDMRAYPTSDGLLAVFWRDVSDRKQAERALFESEQRLRLVDDGAVGYAIFTMDPARRVTSWSQGAAEVFGYSADEIIGQSADVIFTPEDRAAGQPSKEVAAARETGCANDQRWHLRKDGSRVFMNGSVHPLPRDEHGREQGFIKVARDETEQRRAAQALAESELRFRNMADQAPVIMWVTDPNGNCTYLNRRWHEFTGQTEEEGTGLGWLDAVHPDDQPAAKEAFLTANAERRDYRVEFRIRRADGVYRWAIDAAAARFSPEGEFLGYVGSVIDIDERREAEQALRQTRDLLQAVMESVPGVVYAKDREGRMLAANRGTVELVGKSLDEILGRTDREFLDNREQAEAVMANDRRIVEEARTEVLEEEVSLPDGSRAIWLSTKSPFRDGSGAIVGLIGASLDITQRKLTEEQLRLSEARFRFLNELDEGLRFSPDAPAAMLVAAELLARKLNTSRCAYADVDADHDSFVIRDDYTAPGVASSAGTYSLDLFGKQAAGKMRGGQTLVVRNVANEVAEDDGRDTFRSIGIEAIVCCPLVKQGRLVAMMAVHQNHARDWQPDEIRLVEATVERCWAHVERVSAEARLRESEERLRLATEAAEIGFWDVDLVRDVLIWPPRVKAMFGISPDVSVTMQDFYAGLHPDDRQATEAAFLAAADPGRRALYDVEYRTIGKEDGVVRWVAAKGRGVFDAKGRCVRVIGSAIDVTRRRQIEERLRELNEDLERKVEEEVAERARAEEQLRQAQKMEAVGHLTGGIAHDFNNLLTAVIGSLDMMQRRMAKGETDKIERYATTAMTAANRAAALTHRLLAFARRQPLDPKPVNANRLVTGMEELLRRTIGEGVSLEIVTAGGLWRTLCDPHQLESAILNLAINARDAMPNGGKLTIETCNARLDDAYAARQRDVKPGQYVCICVTDTGHGMSADVIAKAFEPFFTTKPIGQGTGLGLSMIYGFARQSEGYARIYSEVGTGTTVKLYLPRYYGEAEDADADHGELTDAHRSHAGEAVLVVEDEAAVRDLVVDVLQELGYRAIEASDGPTGLKLLQSDLVLDLLISDVGLPGLNGRQLADAARKLRPELKVLFMTGYAESATIANGFLEPGMQMITKPFAIEALATRIRDMIKD